MATSQLFHLAFLKKEPLGKHIFTYSFDLTDTEFLFKAGQYVQITLPHENADERGTSRFFTIASSPTEKDVLMIVSRKGKSSFKMALFDLQPGAKVQFFGPMGTFVLPV